MKKLIILFFALFTIILKAQKEINVISNKLTITKYNPINQKILEPTVASEQVNTITINRDLTKISISLLSKSEVIETIDYNISDYKIINDNDFGEMLQLSSMDSEGVTYKFFLTTKLFMIESKLGEIAYSMIYSLYFPSQK